MDTSCSYFFTILLFALLFFIYKFIEFYKHKRIYSLLSWSGSMNLEQSILHVQKDLCLPKFFCVTQEDLQIIEIITSKFREDTVSKYFRDYKSFYIPKSKYHLDGETYFLYLLLSFLDAHQCDYIFDGYQMCGKELSRREYDGGGWDATYNLTDFGIVFYKLLYITHIYCKNSKAINPEGKYYGNEKAIADIVESKTISVSCYRP